MGLKGVFAMDINIELANSDLHSGVFGGMFRNAPQELSFLLASLFDKDGKMVAKTERGKLVFLQKKVSKQVNDGDINKKPAEEDEKSGSKPAEMPMQGAETSEFGVFADGTPRRMAPPTRSDGTPKEDLGPLTVTFGRFNPPTIGHQKLLDAAKKSAGKGALKILQILIKLFDFGAQHFVSTAF